MRSRTAATPKAIVCEAFSAVCNTVLRFWHVQVAGTKFPNAMLTNHTMAGFGRTLIVVLEDSRARFFRLENSGRLADGLPDIASGIDGSTGLPAERTEKRKRYLTAVMTAVEQACEGNECDRLMAVGP